MGAEWELTVDLIDLSVCVSYQFTAHQLESYSYLFCDNGLDPCITSRLQSVHC